MNGSGEAESADLDRVPSIGVPGAGAVSAGELLMVVAFAHAPGWSAELWATALHALTGRTVTPAQVEAFATGPGAGFVSESTATSTPGVGAAGTNPVGRSWRVFRLAGQALSGTVLAQRARLAEHAG